jgi:hypothetical protein
LSNFDENKYEGLFLTDHGVLLKGSQSYSPPSFKRSWVLNRKTKKNDIKNKYTGSIINDNGKLDYIFYDVGNLAWCNSVYLSKSDVAKIKQSLDIFYDNMFLFEIINKSISANIVKYDSFVVPSDEIIMITGIKDKHKIKETL